jgi:glycosyltransferase involved in cell wall biosynthesis
MNKLRIALTTGNYHHVKDGVSLTLNRLVRYLTDEGHQVLVLAPTSESPAMEHEGELFPAKSVSIPGREEYRWTTGLNEEVRERLRTFKPDLVHIATPDMLGTQTMLYALRKKIPIVCSYHTHFHSYLEYYNMEIIGYFGWRFLRWFYRQAEHNYVPSDSMISTLKENGLPDNMRIWARGIELDRFNPSKRSQEWRLSMGVAPSDVLVTMVSRLVWEKEMDTLRNTYALLHEQYPGIKTMVVGDGPALQEMKNTMPETIFTGHLDGDELARSYASSDIFVFPSITETFGNVTLEALASGVPAVVANAQGNSSLVWHGKHGFLVTPRSHQQFAKAVGVLISDADKRSVFSENARTFATGFSWPVILSGLVDNYYEAIRAYKPR